MGYNVNKTARMTVVISCLFRVVAEYFPLLAIGDNRVKLD